MPDEVEYGGYDMDFEDTVPPEVMDEISANADRKKADRDRFERKYSGQRDNGAPQRDPSEWTVPEDRPSRHSGAGIRPRARNGEGGARLERPERSLDRGDLRELRSAIESLGDQLRVVHTLVSTIEMSISKMPVKSEGSGCSSGDIEEIRAILKKFDEQGMLLQLDGKFDVFTPENMEQIFARLEEKMKVLNDRSKSWQLSLDQACSVLGKKAAVYAAGISVISSGLFAAVVFFLLRMAGF